MGNSPNATACLSGWLGHKNMFGIWASSNRWECGCVIFQSWYYHHNIFLPQKASVKVEAAAAWRSLCMWWRSLRRACSNECSNTPTFWRRKFFKLSEIYIWRVLHCSNIDIFTTVFSPWHPCRRSQPWPWPGTCEYSPTATRPSSSFLRHLYFNQHCLKYQQHHHHLPPSSSMLSSSSA